MSVLDFVVTVIVVTGSGALAPGPLFFGTLLQGTKFGAKAGVGSAIGHTIVEFPLVLFLALGLLTFASQPFVKAVVALVGGIALLGFGIFQIRESMIMAQEGSAGRPNLPKGSIALGTMLTAFNPFFILWWLTVGSKLVVDALIFASMLGVLIMYISHVWMDYAFLAAAAHFASKGRTIIGSRVYRYVVLAFGLSIIYFGVSFLVSALT